MNTKDNIGKDNQETRNIFSADSDSGVSGLVDSGAVYTQRNYVRRRLLPELRRYIARSGGKAIDL